jgi:hypothetical protein
VIDRRLVLIIAMLAVFALATQAVVWFLAPREEESAFAPVRRQLSAESRGFSRLHCNSTPERLYTVSRGSTSRQTKRFC